ncbi:MAG: hypothetical protein A3G34_15025 [Candidatus Lindowbacteria bacterium RIFCSPLOWO2_12_FULL_62_27]|nr:MAG: hypothetical protein A3G34_15025 [Candidatus Lindowbacteria bacterium RIFCSPLOWO2_12_FULL_62_27]OGH63841.1 MAG: hypothetical protein A3I06_06000 [Candidatus Lindowbacteria bacterium RIFCSPLOWO2_02_FULL_62_12]
MRLSDVAARTTVAALAGLALILPANAVIPDTDIAFLTTSSPVTARSDSFMPSMLRPILLVMLFGSLMIGSLYLAWRRRRREAGSDLIQVLATSSVAQGVMVQILDVGGVLFVVSMSRSGIVSLGQITDRDKISEIRTRASQEALAIAIPPIPFKNALSRFFRRPPAPTVATPDAPVRPSAREKTLQEVFDRIRRLNPKENEK